MPKTYEPIQSQTLSVATATVTFSSIPSTYTDLKLVIDGNNTSIASRSGYIRFNGDTGTNYSFTYLHGISGDSNLGASGTGSTVAQSTFSNILNDRTSVIMHILGYSNTTKQKAFLARGNASSNVQLYTGLWRSTAAINSLSLFLNADSWAIGTIFTLYGIKAA